MKRVEEILDSKLAVAMIGSRGFSSCYSGLETHVHNLSQELARRNQHITVYGRLGQTLQQIPGNCREPTKVEARDVFCLGGKLTATISNSLWATRDAIRSGRFDILHFHGIGCVFGILLARGYGIPTVLTLHSTNWHERKWSAISKVLIRTLEWLAVHSADEVIVVSKALESRLENEYDVRAHVIPNGAYQKGIPDYDSEVLSRLGLEKDSFVLFAGRVVPDKGCHVLLDAFTQAHLSCKLVFAGAAEDEVYLRLLKEHSTNNVMFVGFQSEVELGALYRNCSLFCSASVSEGQSISVLEALAHGARCLVSDIPPHRELVDDAGMRFPVDDACELCAKLAHLVNHKADSARQRADWPGSHPQYRPEKITESVLLTYASILDRLNCRKKKDRLKLKH